MKEKGADVSVKVKNILLSLLNKEIFWKNIVLYIDFLDYNLYKNNMVPGTI